MVCCDPQSQRLQCSQWSRSSFFFFFFNSLAFSIIQWMLAIWSLVFLPFLNTLWSSESSQFTYSWILAGEFWALLCYCMRWVQLWGSLNIFVIAFLWDWMKTDLFQFCGYCCVFQICWHIEYSTLTVSSFRIWNSSALIPSPPLTLFMVMIPKAHLTLHSKMPDSRWVLTPLWLSGSEDIFFIVLLCILLPLFNIFCFS